MHIHKFVFVLFAAFIGALLALIQGCSYSHVTPMTDAGPLVSDGGPIIADAGPMTTVDITPRDMPPGGVLVADDTWHEVARVWIGHSQNLPAICLELDGDPADIADVAIASYGRISHRTYFHGIRSGGFSGGTRVCVELDDPIETLPLIDSTVTMLVLVRIAPTATSGDSFRVGITGADRLLDGERYRADIETLWSNRFEIL